MRTRFAPSPTGYMHIGNLKAALFGYLLAKSMNGTFILRIEDTDQQRLVDGSVEIIYKTLKTAGIIYDEGPDIGGQYGPYIQSERKSNYLDFAQKLVDDKKAYYCFCTKERLQSLGENAMYDRHCRNLPDEQIAQNLANNLPYTIRQIIPEGKTTFTDENFGEITVENKEMEDQILIKSDLMPTYNFANVIDDNLMGITHVLRGSEYLVSTPKYNLLYEAFGWQIPKYVHLPLVLNQNGEKMSKRRGDASFEDLLELGYLPSAIVNYIALLGFSPEGNQEIFSMDELIQNFSIKRMSKSPAIFDITKLNWVNSEHIKLLSQQDFYNFAINTINQTITRNDINKTQIANMAQGRISNFADIANIFDFIDEMPSYSLELYEHKKMKTNPSIAKEIISKILPELETYENWSNEGLYQFLTSFATKNEYKNSQVLWSIRTGISGKAATPGGASELLAILGKNDSIKRLQKSKSML